MSVNILLVDDHQVLADGIMALLGPADEINSIHHALDAKSALQFLKERDNIDLILLDINLPDIDGLTLCQKIATQYPDIRILALTMHSESGFISKMIKAGAHGYLLKNTGKEELLEAINTLEQGKQYFSKEVTDQLLAGMQRNSRKVPTGGIPRITRREKEILSLIVEELTTEEIAEKLFISASTVISHRKSLLRKLNAKNSAGLVKAAYEYNLLD